ncbi:MAG: hypothetical protein AAF556_06000 [Pseudomonadota bacterium]
MLGLVTGLKDVKRGATNMLARQSAERLANKIDRALNDPKVKVDGATATYLKAAYRPLAALGRLPSSQPTGQRAVTRFGPVDDYGPNPAWDRAFDAFKRDMAHATTAFVNSKFGLVGPTSQARQTRAASRLPGTAPGMRAGT